MARGPAVALGNLRMALLYHWEIENGSSHFTERDELTITK